MHEEKSGCAVAQEGRVAHLWEHPIVRDGDDYALARKGLAKSEVIVFLPALPATSIEEKQDWRGCGQTIGNIEVKLLAGFISIEQIFFDVIAAFRHGHVEEDRK